MKRVVAIIAVLAAIAVAVWWFGFSSHNSAANTSAKQQAVAVSPATVQYFHTMETALNSDSVAQQSAFVANEVRPGYLATKQPMAPKDSTVSFKISSTDSKQNTFVVNKKTPDTATVEFSLNTKAADGKVSTQVYLMVLARETNSITGKQSWLIVYTEVKK